MDREREGGREGGGGWEGETESTHSSRKYDFSVAYLVWEIREALSF